MRQKPILIYDGDCGFCKYWVNRWKRQTKGKISYQPYQQMQDKFDITEDEFQKSVWLVVSDERKFSAAEAVVKSLALAGKKKWYWIYKNIPLMDKIFELSYLVIAKNRSFFFKLTKLFFGEQN
jgi:predicted DCC family thiol-disulfide oxidoreductase YuxK